MLGYLQSEWPRMYFINILLVLIESLGPTQDIRATRRMEHSSNLQGILILAKEQKQKCLALCVRLQKALQYRHKVFGGT